jgi:hypothetical protein
MVLTKICCLILRYASGLIYGKEKIQITERQAD